MSTERHDTYVAHTESGATYTVNSGGGVLYESVNGSRMYFRNWILIDRPSLKGYDANEVFQKIHELGFQAVLPQVGLSIYGFNFDEWRISTPIVRVEEVKR